MYIWFIRISDFTKLRIPMMDINFFISFCILLVIPLANGQQKNPIIADSLKGKTYAYFLEKIEDDNLSDHDIEIYSAAYLLKAKEQKNWKELVNAYKIILHQSDKSQRIFYADSMIYAAKHTNENDLIGSAYLTKGIVYYDFTDYNNAFDNYLLADKYVANTDDLYLKYKIKYNIAQIKYYLGFYDDAMQLFQENVKYFKNEHDIPYLTSLHSLGLCYNRLSKYDLCTQTNDLGIKEASRLKYFPAIPRFINSEGINQFFRKNYAISIAKLNETLPNFIKNKDFAGETVTHFYLGKNYLALNKQDKAIEYFLKVDKAFIEKNYIYPDLRESFEILIDYYKNQGNLQERLKYIDHLLKADKYLDSNFKYLTGRIHKEYDTKKLISEKDEIEKSFNYQKRQNWFFIFLIVLLLSIVAYMVYKARENKRKFKKLIERKSQQTKLSAENKLKNTDNLNISKEVIASVLKHLDKFETSEKFLAKDIKLPKLARMCDSNIVYVSKIISHSRQKKSTDYINDLKIDWIISQMQENSKFRNYTNKALSEEAGFSTTQHFTRAFVKNTGISPTYFVQELKKTIEAGNLS